MFYQYVNSKKTHKSGVAPLKDENGNLVVSDADKAEILNKYFIEVGTIDNGILPPFCCDTPNSDNMLRIVYFDCASVIKCIGKLKNKSSAGPDGSHQSFLSSWCTN